MDATQIVIIISIVIITIVIGFAGTYLVLLLKELKSTVVRANRILVDAQMITESVARPVSSISEFVMGFKGGLAFFNKLFKKDSEDES